MNQKHTIDLKYMQIGLDKHWNVHQMAVRSPIPRHTDDTALAPNLCLLMCKLNASSHPESEEERIYFEEQKV